MPLFDWTDALKLRYWLNVVEAYDYDQARIRQIEGRDERERHDRERLSRVRWQEKNGAERSFACGIVVVPETDTLPRPSPTPVPVPPPPSAIPPAWEQPTPPTPVGLPPEEAKPLMRTAEVTAAVLPNDVVFLLADGIGEIEEAGRLPRSAIREIDVVDEQGQHVPEPSRETIEPSTLVFALLRWSNDGAPDEERFAFRSPWMAWQAARRLLETKTR